MKLIISQKEVVLKIHRREHALSKIYKESIINRFMMKNLKIHHQMMNLITQKKTWTEILKTIPNFKRIDLFYILYNIDQIKLVSKPFFLK